MAVQAQYLGEIRNLEINLKVFNQKSEFLQVLNAIFSIIYLYCEVLHIYQTLV